MVLFKSRDSYLDVRVAAMTEGTTRVSEVSKDFFQDKNSAKEPFHGFIVFHDVSSDKHLYHFKEILTKHLLPPIYHCNIIRNIVLLMDHKEQVPYIAYYRLGIKREQLSLSFLESQPNNAEARLLTWMLSQVFSRTL